MLRWPNWERLWYIAEAFRAGFDVETIHELSHIDPWFLANIQEIVEFEERLGTGQDSSAELLREARTRLCGSLPCHPARAETHIRARRLRAGIHATFKRVDTCAAEFEAYTPYLYSHTNASARPIPRRGARS
jgi:carbamoyl-phosphate synthase large subunit